MRRVTVTLSDEEQAWVQHMAKALATTANVVLRFAVNNWIRQDLCGDSTWVEREPVGKAALDWAALQRTQQ
jgi:predicted transcriptional regulator